MCGKPGKGRHGTSHHAKAIYQISNHFFAVMKTFVTVISASTGRNDLIFDIWLWQCDLYRVSPFQVYPSIIILKTTYILVVQMLIFFGSFY
jgi:hypothetical protein